MTEQQLDSGKRFREADAVGMLRRSGLRPTRQRVGLYRLLYGRGDRHVSAYTLHEEAINAKLNISLATVYNTLHHLTQAGLLRALPVGGSNCHFDTNTSAHHHFFFEDGGELVDIPDELVRVGHDPEPPAGYEIVSIDVVVRLKRRGNQSASR